MLDSQVKSKRRVTDHGEVFTAKKEVEAMLELVQEEIDRIESRILEPACGDGNFLAEILIKKLNVIEKRYGKSKFDFERYGIIAISSLYGIDILEDNVISCRERLHKIFNDLYSNLYREKVDLQVVRVAEFLLEKNIVWGDALSLKTVESEPKPLIFSEWSPVNHELIKRRDFSFKELMSEAEVKSMPLFSDAGEEVYIPTPIKEFPTVSFLKINDAE